MQGRRVIAVAIACLFVLSSCAGPDAARMDSQIDALTERVQTLEGRLKKVEALARRAKGGKAAPGKAKGGKVVPGGKTAKPGSKVGKPGSKTPGGGAPGRTPPATE